TYQDEQAVEHIMQVACGLDSMVLGEPQILGQLKAAYSESCAASAVSASFHRLFQQVFAIAKEVRTTTAIGACPVSVASAAVHFARQLVPDFTQANITLIGAGDTTELLIRYLKTHLTKPITLVNRNIEKAKTLLAEPENRVYGFDKLMTAILGADILFSATSSLTPVVTKTMMMEVMSQRRGKPLVIIDVAVPRDIDPTVVEVEDTALYTVDDLKDIIEKNRQGREHAAEKAREIARKKSIELIEELKSLDTITRTICAYRQQIEAICHLELVKAKQQLQLGADPVDVLNIFASAFTKKLLHKPSVQLRQAGVEGRFEVLKFAKQLFSIPDPEIERL
ncbi:MAG: glutamyl-tRNA reductase, partial [Gammaproteobacteria bacterium]|nr:glutamyl-tRNA reductase [Gammaproteobacteria bacterium]